MGVIISSSANHATDMSSRPGGVLLVEDDELYLTLYRNSLRSLAPDIALAECTNGYDALLRLAETTPRLVILDLHMPAFDGYNFISIVKSKPAFAELAVIVITSDRSERTWQLLQFSNVFILYKPVDPADLISLAAPFVRPGDAGSGVQPVVGEDGRMLQEFAQIFFEQVPHRIAQLQQATVQACTTSGNFSGLREWIHAMRGTASFVNAPGLNRLIERLSAAVKAGDTALIISLENQLTEEMQGIAIDLDHHYQLSRMGSGDREPSIN